MVEAAEARFEHVDILVNNAGLFPHSPFLDTSEELYDRTIDVSVKGTFLCSQAYGRYLARAGGTGVIVNLGSHAGYRPSPQLAHYSAAKAAVIQLTQALALELAPHVRVNAVAPGPIDSEGAARASVSRGSLSGTDADSVREGYRKRIALGRFGAPDEVARLVLFLACDASSFITGTTVLVDGGARHSRRSNQRRAHMPTDQRVRSTYRLISSDGHIVEPPDVWVDRVPAKYKDRCPRIERLPEGDAWIIEGVNDPVNFGWKLVRRQRPQVDEWVGSSRRTAPGLLRPGGPSRRAGRRRRRR